MSKREGRLRVAERTAGTDEGGEIVIAVDLGGTNLRAAAVDRCGRINNHVRYQTPHTDDAEDIVHAIIAAARECERRSAVDGARVRALAVALPGTVEAKSGVVMNAPNIPCINGFRLRAALTEEISWPVILENDANAAAIGEMWRGSARAHRTIVCLTLGTGVGGGIILDGQLWRGVDGAAGEIGHMSVEPFGQACNCGSRGCLEVYASATAIARMAREGLARYPNSPLHSIRELTAKDVYEHGLAGDELSREVFRRMGQYLGIGLANLVNLLNPELIVIGGGAANGWDLFIEHAQQEMLARAFPIPARRARIVRAACGDDAGLLGVAHLAFGSL
ncbi:ROK family protein [Pyrinomonas methylaliphatogenes]|uniref:Transcriptional regulator/sugar kinase n=1 Tax=Pyrinomonas methylaliphatogenes TaxID=454194 RepID=A0A0B6WSD1_9BACT|nr:ROK family protein [Pyrinomonas methylaliphatogenes]CDM64103.1 transcriptional regulator/sugar kinase [Pyrinomonas methylaliphatogenes]